MRRLFWFSTLTVVVMLGGALLLHAARRSSEAFREERVSFGASYVCPAQDVVIYTRMSHAVGRYEIVTQRRGSARATVVSGDDRTAAFGVSDGDRLAYTRIQGNVVQLALLRPAHEPLAVTLYEGPLIGLGIGAGGNWLATVGIDAMTLLSMENLSPMRFPFDRVLSAAIWEATLSGDGAQAVVLSSSEGFYSLDLVGLFTADRKTLKSSVHLMSRPRWTADSSALTFVERTPDGWEVHEKCLDGGADRIIYRTFRFIESAELHRDGRRLLLTLGDHAEFEGYFTALHVFEADLASGGLERVGW